MMPVRKLSAVVPFLFVLFCLVLSQAQTNSQFPAIPLDPNIQGTPSGASAAPPTAQAVSRDNSTRPNGNGGKYLEYQSLCRLNEYDIVKYYISDLKKKRVDLIKEKIASARGRAIKLKLRLIKEHIDQDELPRIKPIVEELKKEKLNAFESDFLNALVYYSTKNYNAALAILNKTLLENKNNIELLLFLAEVYTAVENYYEAGTIYEDLNKLTDNNYLVQLCETTVLNSLNAEAEKICTLASNKFPDNPIPMIYRGISFREREESKRAIFSFKKSVNLKPTEMGYVCLAEALFMKGSLYEAAENFKNAMKIVTKSTRATVGLAWAQLKLKNYKESVSTFKRACSTNVSVEAEIRKAIKLLAAEKIPEVKLFSEAADSCGR